MQQKLTKVALVGSPNVGKSALFNYLTGTYVAVSNYPGTTVDVSRGRSSFGGRAYEIIDTPGIYSLIPMTEEEEVTRKLLCQEEPDIVLHVVDAKNLGRMLNITLQMMDAGLPVILILNVIDEARGKGILINLALLEDLLGIPVLATSAIKKTGLDGLKKAIAKYRFQMPKIIKMSDAVEQLVDRIGSKLPDSYGGLSRRIAALLLIQGDPDLHKRLSGERVYPEIMSDIRNATGHYRYSLDYAVAVERQEAVDRIISRTVRHGPVKRQDFMEKLGRWTREPLTGIPILCLVLYFGLYRFVGGFGAGFLVDYLHNNIFAQILNPLVESLVEYYIPWEAVRSLIIGEFGVFSLGVRYAAAIILPVASIFFLMFAILEDSGYLPRMAMLVDGLFRYFGLNGRAIIPLTLGLGCGTMAVIVTRTLETRRERILATFLLSLAIPCSAQLGVVLALLSHNPHILAFWLGYVAAVFSVVGWLSAKVMPGERSAFYMEIPPLRCPQFSNVVTKAYMRMTWYFMEILPVFIWTSLLLWLADRSGLLAYIILLVKPFMTVLGLPPETVQAFLLGFFRRDYGAAGLYNMCKDGILSDRQLLVSAITLTLFVPCVAQFAVMVKERGLLISISMILFIIILSFLSGILANSLLSLTHTL